MDPAPQLQARASIISGVRDHQNSLFPPREQRLSALKIDDANQSSYNQRFRADSIGGESSLYGGGITEIDDTSKYLKEPGNATA